MTHFSKASLGFRGRRSKVPRGNLTRKILAFVRTVTEGFVLRVAASAKAHGRPSAETEFLPFLIEELKLSFDSNWPIIEYRHFSCHEFPPAPNKSIPSRVALSQDSW
jgi:hypothetical protein